MRSGKMKLTTSQFIKLALYTYDIFAVSFAWFFGLLLRWDGYITRIPEVYMNAFRSFLPIYVVICIIIFRLLRMYSTIWRFAGHRELQQVVGATAITWILHTAGITILYSRMPITYYITGGVLQFLLTIGIRFIYRFVRLLRIRRVKADAKHRVMVIGAGDAGHSLVSDINDDAKYKERVVCFIDDDPNTHGRTIDGVPVEGGREVILSAASKYEVDMIYLAIPSAGKNDIRDILNICKETGAVMKILPDLRELGDRKVSASELKNVKIEDLLGREPIRVDMSAIFRFLEGKVILVTGGGGSIGSELCRQIAAHSPKQLIIFDVYENNAYDIQLELKKKYPDLDLVTLIGSVRDSRRMFQIFNDYKPQVVYHAAAHKHVPLMEDSPCEAIKNNAIGTYKTAFAAIAHGCERFVLISTDKAVNPTNVMGTSKRLCEMIIQSFDRQVKLGKAGDIPQLFTHYVRDGIITKEEVQDRLRNAKTEFVAVRFGNVLGSNGSVIPLFRRQIEEGGPVTVTHPDIIRYFMTIPEAVSLVLTAGTYAHGGEIFVLDMGSPVKIDTLARNLIRLMGLTPDVDIKVEYSGLRPGEKLYEEKLMAEEGMRRTDNELIHIGSPIPFNIDVFLSQLEELMDAAYKNDGTIRDTLQKVVSTYHPA